MSPDRLQHKIHLQEATLPPNQRNQPLSLRSVELFSVSGLGHNFPNLVCNVVAPKMSDDELQEALSEYEKSSLLLPPRLVPGLRGSLSTADFCHWYELPEDIPPLLAQMGIKDAHGFSSKRLSDLRDKGMAPRSIKMLQLAVIRFSSESRVMTRRQSLHYRLSSCTRACCDD